MSATENLRDDLHYVRTALRRRGHAPFPPSIALLWAAICLAGFAVVDMWPGEAWKFWVVAAPAGFVLSMWLGFRRSREAGEEDRAEAMRWASHWLGLLAASGLLGLGFAAGALTADGFGAVILLLITMAYFTAGIHLSRPLLLVAPVLAGGYLAVLYVEGHVWLWLGAVTAIALAATPFLSRRDDGC